MSSAAPGFIIRPAKLEDIPSITDINNHYIRNTVLTFATEERNPSALEKIYADVQSAGLPFLVAEDSSSKQVIGYASASLYHPSRAGYRYTVELSLFCHPAHVRRGAGRQLLLTILQVLQEPGRYRELFKSYFSISPTRHVLALMAVDIDMPGQGLKLRDFYTGLGFEERGYLTEVGWKKERWIDVIILQLDLTKWSLSSKIQ